jgi:hypothetical protein
MMQGMNDARERDWHREREGNVYSWAEGVPEDELDDDGAGDRAEGLLHTDGLVVVVAYGELVDGVAAHLHTKQDIVLLLHQKGNRDQHMVEKVYTMSIQSIPYLIYRWLDFQELI